MFVFYCSGGGTNSSTGTGLNNSNRGRLSAFIPLLAFIEGGNQYNQIVADDATNPPHGPHAWASWGPWNTSPPFMRCPSDSGYTNSTRTNSYALSAGDMVEGLMSGVSGQLPPNAASCADGGINGDSVHLVIPPASRHTGGVNVTLCDGSVRFISNNVDSGNLNARQTISGPSMYGAWGALGSRSGGEVSSIPE